MRWTAESTSAEVHERSFELEREGRRVPGVLWTPGRGDGTGARPLVLVGHGASGSKREDYVVALARRLVRHHGLAVAAIDGPVHGDRRDDPDPPAGLRFLEFSAAWSSDTSMTDDMVADWRATIDTLQELPDVGSGPVGWWGLSMGTILGLPLVASEPRCAVAVFGLMGLTGPTRQRLAWDAPAVKCPVLFLVQLGDELFAVASALELFEAIGSADKRLLANPGRHGAVPPDAFAFSERFLAEHLG